MKYVSRLPPSVVDHLRAHHGVVSRRVCLGAGMTPRQISGRIERAEWERVHHGVYRIAGAPITATTRLAAACEAVGPDAVVSHRSAAWWWDLAREAPRVPTLSVGLRHDPRLAGIEVHRMADLDHRRVRFRHGLACTDPLRTIVDLAGVAGSSELDDAIDRAMAVNLVTPPGLEAEMDRVARRGRRGIGALRAALVRRGLSGGPSPSVLESRLLRLLERVGIVAMATEVVISTGDPDGREPASYRLDTMIVPGLAVEVDGFRYHHSPEHKTADERRRNRIRLGGTFLLVYTWWDVINEPARVVTEIRAALDARHARPTA